MKYIFIVNANSGKGKSLRIIQNIHKVCSEADMDYEIKYTTVPGEATAIAKKYKDDKGVIFSVGGDGTLNEVLNGIVGSENMLGVIPAGSGNDFYKALALMEDRTPCVDIGKINDLYFINVACIGIDSEIAKNAERMKLRFIPALQIYNISILYSFFAFKFKELEFNIKNKIKKGKFTIVTICNGQYYGGGFRIAPHASLTDHIFDIYFVDQLKKRQMPRLLLKVKKGMHESSPKIHKVQSDRIIIQSDQDITCNVDGETCIDKKFEIELIKNAVTLYNDKDLVRKILQNKL